MLLATPAVLKTIAHVQLKGCNHYSLLKCFAVLPGGFAVVFEESPSNRRPALVKVSWQGNFIREYTKRGQGPGELSEIGGIVASDDAIFVSEFFLPMVHVFSHDVQFINDFRVKSGGKIVFADDKYIAIWNQHFENDVVYMLTLYDSVRFDFFKYAFPVPLKEVPQLAQYYGGIAKINGLGFAGVYSSDYRIKLFDHSFSQGKKLITRYPGHIKKYHPWRGNTTQIDMNQAQEWMNSWAIIHSVFFVDNHYIIEYSYDGKKYFDVLSRDGDMVYCLQELKNFHSVSQGNHLFTIEVHENNDFEKSYSILKQELVKKEAHGKK